MPIKQLSFLIMPQLLLHGVSVYNGHLRGPVTLTPIAQRLAVELSPLIGLYDLSSVTAGIRAPTIRMPGERSLLRRHRFGAFQLLAVSLKIFQNFVNILLIV